MYIKTKIDNLTKLDDITSEDMQSRMSLYYTPTERSVSKLSLTDPLAGIHINYIEGKPKIDSLYSLRAGDLSNGTVGLKSILRNSKQKPVNSSLTISSDDVTEVLEPLMVSSRHSASLPDLATLDDELTGRKNGKSRNETAL